MSAAEEELRLSLAEARLLAECLETANVALLRANQELERRVSERTAELEAANAALQAGEEHLRLIFESATEYAIFTLGLDGRVTSWNPGAQRILGREADAILGQPAEIIFTPEDRAARVHEIEMCRAVEESRAADECWHLRANGSRFWASGMMMPLPDSNGELRGFLRSCVTRRPADARRSAARCCSASWTIGSRTRWPRFRRWRHKPCARRRRRRPSGRPSRHGSGRSPACTTCWPAAAGRAPCCARWSSGPLSPTRSRRVAA
ncbi:PAS domain S-box protein [Siccirubricoccus deserti]|uniref:PAS domain S-box protein n=1 Tax=Siccirubricoccus deserti TaxID=2013562 RepID=A0A9X0UG32_9PROT|nr:PAS domain S-box protein [Siccirubricoccus deserti]